MPNSIPKPGIITTCVYRRRGRWQLSCRGCFFGSIPTELPYGREAKILVELGTIRDASLISVRIMPTPAPTSPKARKGFDYTSLDVETSQFVQRQTGEIRGLMKRTAQGIIEVGQKLIEVKGRLGHGRFLNWLEAEFEWADETARRFMNVAQQFGQNPQVVDFAPSALYVLAAPSVSEAARSEAIARAQAGESITYTEAKAIKQKYALPSIKPKSKKLQPEPEPQPELVSQPQQKPTLTPVLSSQAGSKLEIVALRHQSSASTLESATSLMASQAAPTFLGSQPSQPVSAPDVPGVWWQLGGRHLLYCGDPNSLEFLGRVREIVSLLFAFSSNPDWQSVIRARTRIITHEYLPQGRNLDQLDEFLEASILFNTNLGEVVISCFLPSPVILSIVNRTDRRGLFAEPDPRRVNAVISTWKKAGLKAERISNVN